MLLLSSIILLASAEVESKIGVGVVLGYPTGFTVKPDDQLSIHLGYAFSPNGSIVRSNIDRWLVVESLSLDSNWYIGAGIGAGVFLAPTSIALDASIRVPVGIQYFPANQLELFAEIAPTLSIFPQTGFGFYPALGMRYYF
jgi:hypothetical protein